MGKECLNCFAGENGNGRMGQGTHSGFFEDIYSRVPIFSKARGR
jgi:hypothetical protein